MRQHPLFALMLCLLLSATACGPSPDRAARGDAPETARAAEHIAPTSETASTTDQFVLVILGDSLTAGHGLPSDASLPAQLQKLLDAEHVRLHVRNAGVSGDTSTQGLARFDWSIPPEADGVVIELGANDMLRGRDPNETRADLALIIERAKARGLWIGLVGMRAPLNAGAAYRNAFDRIYPDLAREYGVALYPSYFDGLLDPETGGARPGVFLDDGVHPNQAGAAIVAEGMAEWLEEALPREALDGEP